MCQSTGFLKTIAFFINFLLLLAGLALLVTGVIIQVKINALTDEVEARYYGFVPIAAMVVGSVILLFGILGCCGAAMESNCMLITYAIFILVLMLFKLALALVVCFNSDAVIAILSQNLSNTFVSNRVWKTGSVFHQIESSLICCGAHDPLDYGVLPLPETCCANGGGECTPSNAYRGCEFALADIVHTSNTAIVGALGVAAALELLAVTTVLCLAKNVRIKKFMYLLKI